MANDIPQNLRYTPIGVEGVVEVNAHLVGGSLVDNLRRTFTVDSQMEEGDYFMDRSMDLLERHLQLMLLSDQTTIRDRYMKARNLKNELHSDDYKGSPLQKLLRARRYKLLSRKTYKIVKLASDRVRESPLINQLAEATQTRGQSRTRSGFGTASSQSNPFADSHAISTLTDISVNDADRVEMSAYRKEGTNEAAVVIDVVGRDKSVQHIVGTFQTEAVSGNRTDGEASQPIASAPAAISLHRDDGSSPRLIVAPLPDVPDQRADEQAETTSIPPNEPTTSKGKWQRARPVKKATVPPVDGDTYTRSSARRRPKFKILSRD